MRKLLSFSFVLLIVVGVIGVVSAAKAQPTTQDLVALARYLPDSTQMFAAFRTDDATIATLDGLVAKVGKFIPGGLPAGASLKSALDQAASSITTGGTFKTVFRSWLGDTAVVGIPVPFQQVMTSARGPQVEIALSVTDKAAAEKFLVNAYKNVSADYFTKSTQGDFTVWSHKDQYSPFVAALSKDTLLLINGSDTLPKVDPQKTLLTNANFANAIAMLPEKNYGMVAYLDVPAINRASMQVMMANMAAMSGSQPAMRLLSDLLTAVYDAVGPEALGFTILDGRALTLDGAVLRGDTSKLDALGLKLTTSTKPVDLSFAANIPADAPLVMQGTELGPAMQVSFDNFRAIGDYVQKSGILRDLAARSGDRHAAQFLGNFNIADLLTFSELMFSGFTGMNLEKDVLSWMDGNYASYLRVPTSGGAFSVDMTLVVEDTKGGAAQDTVKKLNDALSQFRSFKVDFANGVITLHGVIPALLGNALPPAMAADPAWDIRIGANAKVLAMGTRPGVQYSLFHDGASLANDPTFKAAQAYLLPDTVTLGYVNLKPFYPVISRFGGLEGQQAMNFLNILDSGSLSAVQTDKGSVARFVLLLTDKEPSQISVSTVGSGSANATPVPPSGVEFTNGHSTLDISTASVKLTVCADNLAGNTVYAAMWRDEAGGGPPRSWTFSQPGKSGCVVFDDMDGEGDTYANVTYYTVAALEPISADEAAQKRTACYATNHARLCDSTSR
jgi:hypothetical protein